jgi:Protein of unknown function (DUF3592)
LLGVFLDNIIVYLFRTVLRLMSENRSRTWPVVNGKVESSSCPGLFLCPSAAVVYTYTVEGKSYSGVHKRAFFWSKESAEDYADRCTPTSYLVVRYNPGEPMKSVVRYWDQFSPVTEDGKTVWRRIHPPA